MNPDPWARTLEQLPYLLEMLITGALTTVEVTAGGFVVAVVLGLFFAVLKALPMRPLHALAGLYVEVFRGVPVLTQLFVIYFGLASIGIKLEPVPAAIIGFGINGGAYLTEVFRAGIESIHRGQLEAAFTIGMTRLMGLRFIVLPQAIRVVLPPLGNFAVGLLKDTALASAVAAPELTFRGRMLIDQTYLSTQIYLMVAVIYLAMSLPLSRLVRRLEGHMGVGASLMTAEALLAEWMPQLLQAALGTLKMTALAFLIAAFLGLVLALSRLSQHRRLSLAAVLYIEIMRGTPALTQLFLIYFGLTAVGIALPAFTAAVIGLGLNGSAYLAEIYRAGIQAIHRGQREAAFTIGMTQVQTMRWIVLPQAVRVALPPMANYAIALLKDTSIASLISAPELMLRARDLSSEYFMPMELYLLVGAMYLAMAFPLSRAVRYMEFRLARGR